MLLIKSRSGDIEYDFGTQEEIAQYLETVFIENLEQGEYAWNILLVDTIKEEKIYEHTGSMWEYFTRKLEAGTTIPWIVEVFNTALVKYRERYELAKKEQEILRQEEKYREYLRLKSLFEKESTEIKQPPKEVASGS